MSRHNVLLLPGDGIGPEVVGEAKRVMEAVASLHGFAIDFSMADLGGIAIDNSGALIRTPPKIWQKQLMQFYWVRWADLLGIAYLRPSGPREACWRFGQI